MDGETAELLPVSAQKRRLKEEAYDNKKGRDGRKNERKIKIKGSEKHRFGKNGGRQKKEKILFFLFFHFVISFTLLKKIENPLKICSCTGSSSPSAQKIKGFQKIEGLYFFI